MNNARTPEEHDERIRTLLEPIQRCDTAASGEKPAIPDEFEEVRRVSVYCRCEEICIGNGHWRRSGISSGARTATP